MAQGRLNRDQFFEKLAEMEATDLKKERERGGVEPAGALVKRCLTSLPGHPDFRIFAEEISAHPPGPGQNVTASA